MLKNDINFWKLFLFIVVLQALFLLENIFDFREFNNFQFRNWWKEILLTRAFNREKMGIEKFSFNIIIAYRNFLTTDSLLNISKLLKCFWKKRLSFP